MSTEDSAAALSSSYVRNELGKIETRVTKLAHRRFARRDPDETEVLSLFADLRTDLSMQKLTALARKVNGTRSLHEVVYDLLSVVLYYSDEAASVETSVSQGLLAILVNDITVRESVAFLTSYLRCLIITFSLVKSDERKNESIASWIADNEEALYRNLVTLFDNEQICSLAYQCLKYNCMTLQRFPILWICRLDRFLAEMKLAILSKVPADMRAELAFESSKAPDSTFEKATDTANANDPTEAHTDTELEVPAELEGDNTENELKVSQAPREEVVAEDRAERRHSRSYPATNMPSTSVQNMAAPISGQRVVYMLDCLYENLASTARLPEGCQWLQRTALPFMIQALVIVKQIKIPLPLFVRIVAIAASISTLVSHEQRIWEDCVSMLIDATMTTASIRRKIALVQAILHHIIFDVDVFRMAIEESEVVQKSLCSLMRHFATSIPRPISNILRSRYSTNELLRDYASPRMPSLDTAHHDTTAAVISSPISKERHVNSLTRCSYGKRLNAFFTKAPSAAMDTSIAVFLMIPSAHQYDDSDWLSLLHLDQLLDCYMALARNLSSHNNGEARAITGSEMMVAAAFGLGVDLLPIMGCNPTIQDQLVCSLVSLAPLVADLSPWVECWISEKRKEYIPLVARLMAVNTDAIGPKTLADVAEWVLEDVDLEFVLKTLTAADRKRAAQSVMLTPVEGGDNVTTLFLSLERAREIAPLFIAGLPAATIGAKYHNLRTVQAFIQWLDDTKGDSGQLYTELLLNLFRAFGLGLEEGEVLELPALTAVEQTHFAKVFGQCLRQEGKNPMYQEQAVALIQVYSLLVSSNPAAIQALISSAVSSLCVQLDRPVAVADGISILLLTAQTCNLCCESPLALLESYCRYQAVCPTMSLAYAVRYLLQLVSQNRTGSSVLALKAINVAWQIAESLTRAEQRDEISTPREVECDVVLQADASDSLQYKYVIVSDNGADSIVYLPPGCPVSEWRLNCRLTGGHQCEDILGIVIEGFISICIADENLSVRLSGLKTFISLLKQSPSSQIYRSAYEELLKSYEKELLDTLLTNPSGETSAFDLYEHAMDNCPSEIVAMNSCSQVISKLCKGMYAFDINVSSESDKFSEENLTMILKLLSRCFLWLLKFSHDDGLDLIGRLSLHITSLRESRRQNAQETNSVKIKSLDRLVGSALCDTAVHIITYKPDCITPKVELSLTFLICLIVFRFDASDIIVKHFNISLEEIRIRFERCINYVGTVVEALMGSEIGLSTLGDLSYQDKFFTNKLVEDSFTSFYSLDPPKNAVEGSSLLTLLSFLSASRWQTVNPHLWQILTDIFGEWLKTPPSWRHNLELLTLQAFVLTYSKQHLAVSRDYLQRLQDSTNPALIGSEAQTPLSESLLSSYRALGEIPACMQEAPQDVLAYAVMGQIIALRNMVLIARTSGAPAVSLYTFVADEIAKNLSGRITQPFHRLIQMCLIPSLVTAPEFHSVAKYIATAVASPLLRHAVRICDNVDGYNRLATLFQICACCDRLESSWINAACRAFVEAALCLLDELKFRIDEEDEDIANNRSTFIVWHRRPSHPCLTDSEKLVTRSFIEMLSQVPLWRLSNENKRAIVKLMLELLTMLNQCHETTQSSLVHAIMQQLV